MPGKSVLILGGSGGTGKAFLVVTYDAANDNNC